MDESNATARALRCLETLQNNPGITAELLAAELGVSDRAARRYVAVLRAAGVPVESIRGPHGGYRLGRGVRLPPVVFGAAEALGLVMAVLDGHHAASDPHDLVGGALAKIMRALPEAVAAQAEAVRRTTAAAPDRAAARPDPETTTALVHACAGHRRVRITYRSEAGSEWTTDVDPWAVVVRHGRWYLLCYSHDRKATRAYRIDRIRGLEALTGTFEPPADLDPVAMLEKHLATGWELEVEIHMDAPVDAVARHLPPALGRPEPHDSRTTRLVGSTSNPVWYAQQLAAIPVPYRIVKCPELQEAARLLGERLLAAGRAVRT